MQHQSANRRLPYDHAVKYGSRSNSTTVENFRLRVLQSTRVIETVEECRKVIDDIFSQMISRKPTVVAMDCEGVSLGSNGLLTSIQLKLVNGQILIFDIHKCKQLVYSGGLKRLLESQTIIKVIHCCRADRANLRDQFGVRLNNVFDTQVGHQLIERVRTGRRMLSPSLNTVCAAYGAPQNPLKDKINSNLYRMMPRYWAQRPLTEEMLLYAAADVYPLVLVYNAMINALEESLVQSDCCMSPAEIYLLKFISLPAGRREKLKRMSEAVDGVNEHGKPLHDRVIRSTTVSSPRYNYPKEREENPGRSFQYTQSAYTPYRPLPYEQPKKDEGPSLLTLLGLLFACYIGYCIFRDRK